MRAQHSLASFLLVLVKHFGKTIIDCFSSLTCGIEAAEDLIADIAQALAQI